MIRNASISGRPTARRVFGDNNDITLKLRLNYGDAICKDTKATLDDLREAANTLEEIEPIARRVFGSAHPYTTEIGRALQRARALLHVRKLS